MLLANTTKFIRKKPLQKKGVESEVRVKIHPPPGGWPQSGRMSLARLKSHRGSVAVSLTRASDYTRILACNGRANPLRSRYPVPFRFVFQSVGWRLHSGTCPSLFTGNSSEKSDKTQKKPPGHDDRIQLDGHNPRGTSGAEQCPFWVQLFPLRRIPGLPDLSSPTSIEF